MKPLPLILATFLALSCSPRLYPSVDYQRDSTRLKTADTLILRDSIFIDRYQTIREKGDTIYIMDTRTEYRLKYRDRAVHDTTYIEREKLIENNIVTNELTKFQRWQIASFWVLLSLLIVWIGWKVYKIR